MQSYRSCSDILTRICHSTLLIFVLHPLILIQSHHLFIWPLESTTLNVCGKKLFPGIKVRIFRST